MPIGVVAVILLAVSMPSKLPFEPAWQYSRASPAARLPWHNCLSRIDYLGAISLLGSAVSITAALQQAVEGAPFNFGRVLGPLIVAPFLASVFIFMAVVSESERFSC